MRRIPGLLSTVAEVCGGCCVLVGVDVLAGAGWAWVVGGVLAAGFGYLGGVQ